MFFAIQTNLCLEVFLFSINKPHRRLCQQKPHPTFLGRFVRPPNQVISGLHLARERGYQKSLLYWRRFSWGQLQVTRWLRWSTAFFWMFGAGKMAQQGVTHTIPRKDKGPLRGIHFYGVFVLHATSCTAFFVFFGGKSTFGYLKGIHGWICWSDSDKNFFEEVLQNMYCMPLKNENHNFVSCSNCYGWST